MSGDPSYRFICAVRVGDLELSKNLLDTYGLSHSKAWSHGYNLLREALQHDRQEVAKFLLTRGAKVNSKSKRLSETPLHFAVRSGFVEIVDMLLNKDANVNAKDHSDETPLHCAVEKDNLEITKLLLKKKAYIEARSRQGMTPLHIAAQLGRGQITELLLDNGADINSACTSSWKQGNTALHYAAARGDEANVALLLSKGADINANAKYNLSPLHVATDMNRENVVKLLLKHGANVDTRDKNGKTVLCLAVEKGNLPMIEQILEARPNPKNKDNRSCLYTAIHSSTGDSQSKIVEALLRYGFGVNAEDARDSKLLHAAVCKGYLNIVKDLLKLGANVNAHWDCEKGATLLHRAAGSKQTEVAKLLLKYKANINAKDRTDKTPIHYAVENTDAVITKLLLNDGANVRGRPNLLHAAVKTLRKDIVEMILDHEPRLNVNAIEKFGTTALYCAVVTGDNIWDMSARVIIGKNVTDADAARREIVEILLERGARVNAQTKGGVTALHAAAERGYPKVVELLLDRNANVNSVDKKKGTPLHSSAMKGNEEIVKILLDKGALVDAKLTDGNTALHVATRWGHAKAVKLLLDHGADVSDRNHEGATSLHIAAAANDSLDIVETLLNTFEDVDARDREGKTALHIASKHGKLSIVNLLLDHDSDVNITCNDGNTPLDYATLGTSAYNDRHIDDIFDESFDYDSPDDDYEDYRNDYYDYSDHDIERYYHYFDDEFEDSFSDCPYEEVAEILERHIVKMIALNRYVSEKNLQALDLFDDHRELHDECKEEIELMRKRKIGDSNVTFYDILTKGMSQLALYARNKSIVDALETGEHKHTFDLYSGMIDSRFKNGQKRDGLLDSSLKSLSSLSGYALPDLSTIELFNYLSNKDLENLIKAGPSDECDS